MSHRAVGAFLTHCGWNSILEEIFVRMPKLTWPMGADQFVSAQLLVDELRVATRVCEGAKAIPNLDELSQSAVCKNWIELVRVVELREAALEAIKEGGSSSKDLDDLIRHLSEGYS
ncbi:hypothetical protein ACSBR2_041718 [Camellia fascicularis]